MPEKPITSLQVDVKKSIENLYDVCRRGKIAEIPKNHKRFVKAKDELNKRIAEKESKKNER